MSRHHAEVQTLGRSNTGKGGSSAATQHSDMRSVRFLTLLECKKVHLLESWIIMTKVYMLKHVIVYYNNISYFHTSSTAQGGGGSFKDGKPIGEVSWCGAKMAERTHWWTERCLKSPTLALSFSDYLHTYLSIFYVSIYLSIYRSIDRSISLSFI